LEEQLESECRANEAHEAYRARGVMRNGRRLGAHSPPKPYAFMRRVLATPAGTALYRKRTAMIEPVFGDTKFNRKIDRFQRRGRAACHSEWRLITATHNLLKAWRATTAPHAA
jgi:hypothetical protein